MRPTPERLAALRYTASLRPEDSRWHELFAEIDALTAERDAAIESKQKAEWENLAPIRLLSLDPATDINTEQVCGGCGEVRDESHAWSECARRLSEAVDEYLFHDKPRVGKMSAWMRERHELVCARNSAMTERDEGAALLKSAATELRGFAAAQQFCHRCDVNMGGEHEESCTFRALLSRLPNALRETP